MKNKKSFILEIIPYIIIIIIVILIKQYVFSTILVNGPSMETTLYNKDFMILDKISLKFSKLKRFDIVVINTSKEKIIKRIIGLPGETIEYKDNKLYIDGEEVEDNYGSTDTEDFGPISIGDKEYYVLGDNRKVSLDSRYLGKIPEDSIVGKTNLVLFPFNRFGFRN